MRRAGRGHAVSSGLLALHFGAVPLVAAKVACIAAVCVMAFVLPRRFAASALWAGVAITGAAVIENTALLLLLSSLD